MANGAAVATAPAGQAPAGRGEKAAPVMPRSFIVGSRKNDKPDFDQTISFSVAGAQQLNNYQISPSGYLRGVYLIVQCTTAGNAAATAFAQNGPFSALASIRFLDTNSQPMVGTVTGYDLYLINKYGGYAFQGDAEASAAYSVTTGAGATGGSFAFVLYIPLETVARNALTAQLNKSGAAQFSLEMFLATGAAGTTAANVYTTAPTTPGSVRVRTTLVSWLDPEATDARGNPVLQDPPVLNTTQYWHKQNYVVGSGSQFTRLQGIDGLLRMLLFAAYRSGTGLRTDGESDWPDPVSLKYEESYLIQSRIKLLFQDMIAKAYGYDGTIDAAKGRDSGVYPIFEWIMDFDRKPGGELSRSYLPMSSASNLELQGSWTNAPSLDVLVNKVVPYPQGEVKGLAVL